MEFKVKNRKQGAVSTTVHAQVPGWNIFLHVDNRTGRVSYPVTIDHTKESMGIQLDSTLCVTIKMPSCMDKNMLDRVIGQTAKIPEVVTAARELIEKEQDMAGQDPADAAVPAKSMSYSRCMELVNQIINYMSSADNTSDTVRKLLDMGFEADELVTFFDFGRDDVDPVVKEMEEEYGE